MDEKFVLGDFLVFVVFLFLIFFVIDLMIIIWGCLIVLIWLVKDGFFCEFLELVVEFCVLFCVDDLLVGG